MRHTPHAAILFFVVLCGGPAKAEFEFGAYLGGQSAGSSALRGSDPGGAGAVDGRIDWEGRSDRAPVYYGFRAMWWQSTGLGAGLEFTHAKAYADQPSMNALGFQRLELTHGLNLLTANLAWRWQLWSGRLLPFVSAGIGATIPHVDILSPGGRTIEYQLTGPAAQWGAGVLWSLGKRWAVLAEYKGTRSWNEIDLQGGGRLETNIDTQALNLGLSYRFGTSVGL